MNLTKKEERERQILLELQASATRWFTQSEFDRLKELNKKCFSTMMAITQLTEQDIKDLAEAIMQRFNAIDGTEELITIIRDYIQDCKDEDTEAQREHEEDDQDDLTNSQM